jgi:hypothetical protein
MCVLLFLVILPVSFYVLSTNLVYVRSDHPWVLYFVSPVLILSNDPNAPLADQSNSFLLHINSGFALLVAQTR